MTELNTPVSNRSNVDNIVLFNIQFYYFLNYSVPDKIWVESQPEKEGRHCPSCSQSSPSQSPASGGGLVVLIKLREIDGNRNWTNAELYSYQASSPLLRCAVAANMVILSGTTQVFTYTARAALLLKWPGQKNHE